MPNPYADIQTLRRIKKLRAKGLNVAEISRVIKKDYKNTYQYVAFLEGNEKYKKRLHPKYGNLSTEDI